MEAIRSSETSVNNISTRRHIPEDVILHSHRRENLKIFQNFKFLKIHFVIPSFFIFKIDECGEFHGFAAWIQTYLQSEKPERKSEKRENCKRNEQSKREKGRKRKGGGGWRTEKQTKLILAIWHDL
jgi:hypothetical protein